MVRITRKITAAREMRDGESVSWIPMSSPESVKMASQVAEQWRNRQRTNASLRLNRQLQRG